MKNIKRKLFVKAIHKPTSLMNIYALNSDLFENEFIESLTIKFRQKCRQLK